VQTLDDLSDRDLSSLVGLVGDDLDRMRQRQATLPLLVDERWDDALRAVASPEVLLVRGNRFLHLQGQHRKADVMAGLLATTPGDGVVLTFGDAPNDLELLRCGDVAVIVPSASGANQALRKALPAAVIAPGPHGLGWAAVVQQLLDATRS
jgi:predicted mannosyl-3-phosphoglycerate phosphatase (HAD superfamily)